MSLKLPANFNNDIQGRDTNLIPVVVIGSDADVLAGNPFWIISTNSIDIKIYNPNPATTPATIPILLNIPSLKESIDIEKRNYKISSINLDISNFPYIGKRFSELIGDASLINKEVRIFWTSQNSRNKLIFAEEYADNYENDGDNCMQIYSGTIRRYTHDDEKVRLVVEDRSHATLHTDLPLTNLGTGEGVPDKYKNKPIPMVYGHVDRSPLVVSENYRKYQADSQEINFLESVDSGYTDKLDVEIQFDSLQVDIDGEFYHVVEVDQYEYLDNHIGLLPKALSGIVVGAEDTADSFEEVSLTCRKIAIPKFSISNPRHDPTLINADFLGAGFDIDNIIAITDGSLFANNIVLLGERNSEYSNSGSAGLASNAEKLLLSINMDVTPQHDTTDGKNKILGLKINGFNLPKFLGDKVLKANHHDTLYGNEGDTTSVSDTYDNDYNLIWRDGDLHSDIIQDVFGFITYGITGDLYPPTDYDGSTAAIKLEFYDAGYGQNGLHMPIILFSGGLFNSFNIQFRTLGDYLLPTGFSSSSHRVELTGHIDEIGLLVENQATKIFSKDFYANVNGRKYTEELYGVDAGVIDSSGEIIRDILMRELGQPLFNTGTAGTGYDWKYAFTVDKKINSKKLIEGIASASPYIPRFNNMSDFKFDTIPFDGGTADFQIKEADCIDFSFSRTPIEDVYTKIVFKYNWDYAREEFNSSVTVDIESLIMPDYDYEYYGFTPPDNELDDNGFPIHPDSTLTIDDDRGKYIRDDTTADNFAYWYLVWSCNQKLKMKVKLPLKYMDLEIGDFVNFDKVLGGVNAYGKNYGEDESDNIFINGQRAYKNFLITSTNKTLEWVEISCIMMHDLGHQPSVGTEDQTDEETGVTGCMDDAVGEHPDIYGKCSDGTECGAPNCCGDGNGYFYYNFNPDANIDEGCTGFIEDCRPRLSEVKFSFFGTLYHQDSNINPAVCNSPFDTNESLGTSVYTVDGNNIVVSLPKYNETFLIFRGNAESNNVWLKSVKLDIESDDDQIEVLAENLESEFIDNPTDYNDNGESKARRFFDMAIDNPIFKIPFSTSAEEIEERNYTLKFIFTVELENSPDPNFSVIYKEEIPFIFSYDYCQCAPGDVNCNSGWSVLDIVILANWVLADNCSGDNPDENCCAGDINDDGGVSVLDVVVLANCVLASNCS